MNVYTQETSILLLSFSWSQSIALIKYCRPPFFSTTWVSKNNAQFLWDIINLKNVALSHFFHYWHFHKKSPISFLWTTSLAYKRHFHVATDAYFDNKRKLRKLCSFGIIPREQLFLQPRANMICGWFIVITLFLSRDCIYDMFTLKRGVYIQIVRQSTSPNTT